MNTQKYRTRSNILKALAHPTRLFIVDTLNNEEKCVCELTELIGADISTVSKHLSVLRNAGIVVDEKRGNQVFYTLKCPCILKLFDCIESVVNQKNEEHSD